MSRRLAVVLVAVLTLSVTALAGATAFAPAALASATPTLSLDQSAGHRAGATANLGMDLEFADSGGDSPKDLTIELPPGLLANAAIDHGACLQTTRLLKACEVGSGTVRAEAPGGMLPVPIPATVSFDLVAPPARSDLAGLAVVLGGSQLVDTAGIRVRPSGDPDGVGITIDLVLPDSLAGVPISVTEIDSTFDALRYPSSCPSPARRLSVAVDSYNDAAVQRASAPLSVTGCSTLAYAPHLTVALAKAHTPQVAVRTAVTERAADAPTGSMTLSFPGGALYTNIASVRLLCHDPAAGSCTPVGAATAVSPLYPRSLSANVYLTGNLRSPTLTIAFPQPFPLTLVGSVLPGSRSTTFRGLPDIPLTSLSLRLNGGRDALFETYCAPGTGVVRSKLTDENGDRVVAPSVRYRISGCPPPRGGRAAIWGQTVTGLRSGRPTVTFRAAGGGRLGKLRALTFALPPGLGFRRPAHHARARVAGIAVIGARARTIRLVGRRVAITLRPGAAQLRVRAVRLQESQTLRRLAREGRIGKRLHLTVVVLGTGGARRTFRVSLRPRRA